MAEDRQWHLAWAKFDAYRAHIPTSFDEAEIKRYHEIVTMLEAASGEDLTAFRIPDSELKQVPVAFSYATRRRPGSVTMSEERYCDPKFFQQQVDGIVYYFQRLNPPADKSKVGF